VQKPTIAGTSPESPASPALQGATFANRPVERVVIHWTRGCALFWPDLGFPFHGGSVLFPD